MPSRRRTLQAAGAALLSPLVGAGKAGAASPATPTPRLPERRALDQALSAWRNIVGGDGVFSSLQDVALYRDPYSLPWDEAGERTASGAVAPENTEQVIQIVRIADRLRIPIYPISTGKNPGYGGPAPVLSGSVVLDLKRMNRVIEVNERNFYAVVEPGVSYFDLYNHIQAQGAKLWFDCPGLGWGSVIGNALDRGLGYRQLPARRAAA